MTQLVVSIGGSHPAKIASAKRIDWATFVRNMTRDPPVTTDKAARGWYCPAEFSPQYRDSDNFVARYAITFDFDHVEPNTWNEVHDVWSGLTYLQYTTWSHKPDAPRFRVVIPFNRAVSYDEYQALARKVAVDIGIELIARESFVPAQMMYLPCQQAGVPFQFRANEGIVLNVDEVLAEYENWTDRNSWPRRQDGDGVYLSEEGGANPLEKPGIIGEFCRLFTIPEAIAKFDLPYKPTSNPDRWTYTAGSRPEGAIVYDGGLKLHSHHDTDPARGQHNAFDLVRLHRFHELDKSAAPGTPVNELPSYGAMAELVRGLAEYKALALHDFEDLGPPITVDVVAPTPAAEPGPVLAHPLAYKLEHPTSPDWLIPDVLERGVIAVMAGQRGSYKSFLSLHWAMGVAAEGAPVYVVSAEGGDFDRRATAWLAHHAPVTDPAKVPLYVAERRMDLNSHDGIELIRQDCLRLGIRPKLFVLDTYSKLSGGLDENSNTEVKAFIGRLANGLQRPDTGFGATVLMVAHTGHTETGRPRGASALGADTDAEYVVQRTPDGGVTVSRERFKSSPELPPLSFTPVSVKLGRQDAAGNEITSLVMVPSESRPYSPTVRLKGTVQKMIHDLLRQQAVPMDDGEVIRQVAGVLTRRPGDRDQRPTRVARSIESMVALGILHRPGPNRLALNRVVEVLDDEGGEETWES